MAAVRKRTPRVLVVTSGGGHWVQMSRIRPALEDFDVAYASVHADYAEELPGRRFYRITDMNRMNLDRLVKLIPELVGLMLRERPDVVITTGALPGLLALTVARFTTRARTIWIDSIANCEHLSTSGRHARHVAHVWLTQWPDLAGPDGPSYWGAVL